MSQKTLRVHSQAQQEVNEAFEWYFIRSPQAADAFLAELGIALEAVAASPDLYSSYTENTRRCVLGRFPYSVIYLHQEDVIHVIAVAHAKRRPGYWIGRA
jgi:plasmid stabilization system protein ParE